jgi:hypothetical protein
MNNLRFDKQVISLLATLLSTKRVPPAGLIDNV